MPDLLGSFGLGDHVVDKQHDDGADDGDDKAGKIETSNIYVAWQYKAKHPSANKSSYDSDNNVTQPSLLGIVAHNHRGDPSG